MFIIVNSDSDGQDKVWDAFIMSNEYMLQT